jgi:hypothetical protein
MKLIWKKRRKKMTPGFGRNTVTFPTNDFGRSGFRWDFWQFCP